MKKSINYYDFKNEFRSHDRGDQFSVPALRALFEYLEELEEDCGTEIELDVIGLCCEYAEYENLEEFHEVYDKEDYPDLDTLREYTQVIEFGDESFIIGEF